MADSNTSIIAANTSEVSRDAVNIQGLIYMIRNHQVMMDSDLAILYQVETKYLNRAVKRNMNRFPDDFCFQLTAEEYEKQTDEKFDKIFEYIYDHEESAQRIFFNGQMRSY